VLAFRAIQELLNNARTHAQCTQIRTTLDVDESHVRAVIDDNGKGFDVGAVLAPEQKQHIGLSTLKEKAELLGGQLQIVSVLGQGTKALVEIPISSANSAA